jgi:hypothetical protein
MTWTYDPTKFNDATASTYYPPATLGQLMQVRFLVQDNQTARQLLDDNEIYWTLTEEANVFMAAAACCDQLVSRAGSIKSKQISEFKIAYDPMFYRALAASLRARGAYYQIPYAGGISITDKEAQQAQTDWVAPAISRGLDDNPAAPKPSTPSSNPLTTI